MLLLVITTELQRVSVERVDWQNFLLNVHRHFSLSSLLIPPRPAVMSPERPTPKPSFIGNHEVPLSVEKKTLGPPETNTNLSLVAKDTFECIAANFLTGFLFNLCQALTGRAWFFFYDIDGLLLFFGVQDGFPAPTAFIREARTAILLPVIQPEAHRVTVYLINVGNLVNAELTRA